MKKTEKQKWIEMNKEQRKQYFLDYYLFPVSVIAVILAIMCFLGWHFFLKPDEENVLYAAVVDDSLAQEKQEQAVLDMQDILEADGKYKQVHIDDSFYLKDGALDKIQVYLHSQQIDVLILDQDVFEEFAGYGYFQSLDELAGEDLAEKYDTDYVYAAVTEIRMKFLLRTMRRGREPSVSDSSHGIGKSFSAGMVPDLRRDICGCFLDLGLCRNGNTVVCEFVNYKEDL